MKEYIDQINNMKVTTKNMWYMILILTVVTIFLSVSYFSLRDELKIKVELPAKYIYKYAPVVLAGFKGANGTYFLLWAEYITKEIGNFNENNINEKFKTLEKAYFPEDYVLSKKKIDLLKTKISDNRVKQSFIVKKSEIVDSTKEKDLIKSGIFLIKGIAKQFIGSKEINKECWYKYSLHYIQGEIYVKNFTTDCF